MVFGIPLSVFNPGKRFEMNASHEERKILLR